MLSMHFNIVMICMQFEGLEAGLLREADAQAVAYTSQDFLKGINAVKAKATPVFSGWE